MPVDKGHAQHSNGCQVNMQRPDESAELGWLLSGAVPGEMRPALAVLIVHPAQQAASCCSVKVTSLCGLTHPVTLMCVTAFLTYTGVQG
jgi:hypothetical protein